MPLSDGDGRFPPVTGRPALVYAGVMPESSTEGRALVMGILNVTPDSFSDGGSWSEPGPAVRRGLEMIAEGADIVDVGGESSRPGAAEVSVDEELRRVVPVVEALSPHVRVSVDTVKEPVAEAAVDAGATLVNDVSASLWPVAARLGVGWVAMHRRGSAATMQDDPTYDDVVREVRDLLAERAAAALGAGVPEVWIDPGIGFGKTVGHNLELLARLDELVATGHRVLVGTSRKAFLGVLAAGPDGAPAPVADRLPGSLATATWALHQGAGMVRVHDVAATVQASLLVGRPPRPDRDVATRTDTEVGS
jgi:dihydropteroate synthase